MSTRELKDPCSDPPSRPSLLYLRARDCVTPDPCPQPPKTEEEPSQPPGDGNHGEPGFWRSGKVQVVVPEQVTRFIQDKWGRWGAAAHPDPQEALEGMLRAKHDRSIAPLQADLDRWLGWYNTERPSRLDIIRVGHRCT